MERKLRDSVLQKEKFKGYKIADIPNSFDKHKYKWFNQNGLTYISQYPDVLNNKFNTDEQL